MGAYTLLTLVAKVIIIVTIDTHSPVEVDLGDGPAVPLVEVVKQVEGMVHHDPQTYFEPADRTLARFRLVSFYRLSKESDPEIWVLIVRGRRTQPHPHSLHALGVFLRLSVIY